MRERHRLLKGVMYWRMSQSFKARLWNERRAVKELGTNIKDTQKQAALLSQARTSEPASDGGFSERVSAVRARIDQLQQRLAQISTKQNQYLQSLAIRELEAQKVRIETYQVQARYELAAIYDRASNALKAKP
jgi:DNA-binding transcriptional MerR regulator